MMGQWVAWVRRLRVVACVRCIQWLSWYQSWLHNGWSGLILGIPWSDIRFIRIFLYCWSIVCLLSLSSWVQQGTWSLMNVDPTTSSGAFPGVLTKLKECKPQLKEWKGIGLLKQLVVGRTWLVFNESWSMHSVARDSLDYSVIFSPPHQRVIYFRTKCSLQIEFHIIQQSL